MCSFWKAVLRGDAQAKYQLYLAVAGILLATTGSLLTGIIGTGVQKGFALATVRPWSILVCGILLIEDAWYIGMAERYRFAATASRR